MRTSTILFTVSALGLAGACSMAGGGEAIELRNSAKEDAAGVRVTLTDDRPNAIFAFDCEEPAGCDIAVGLELFPAAADAELLDHAGERLQAATLTLIRPDGFEKVEPISYTVESDGDEVEFGAVTQLSFEGQPAGRYNLLLTKTEADMDSPEALVSEYSAELGVRWEEAGSSEQLPDGGLPPETDGGVPPETDAGPGSDAR